MILFVLHLSLCYLFYLINYIFRDFIFYKHQAVFLLQNYKYKQKIRIEITLNNS